MQRLKPLTSESHHVLKFHLETGLMVKYCPKSVTKVSSMGECGERPPTAVGDASHHSGDARLQIIIAHL